MKKILPIAAVPFVVALCVVAGVGFFSRASAATTSSAVVQLSSNLVLVGTVNIQNATITKQVANTFTVDFDLTNKAGAQPDLKYGVLLLQQSGKLQSAIDAKVYSETVSLAENDSKHIMVTYTAPDFLAGDYILAVQVKNGEGFPMGTVPLGSVTLRGSGQYASINGSSCYLTIPQDAAAKHYTIGQGVDLLSSESLIAHCDVTNTSNATMTVVPSFTTYYRSIFGAIVSSSTQSPITLAPGVATAESFTIPKAADPQAYDAVLTLLDAQRNQISNSVTFHYVIHGPSATIQNLVFDKDSYQSGDTAKLSFFWTGSADGFLGSRLGSTNEGTVTVNVQMVNAQGVSCANDYSEPLEGQSEEVAIAIPVTATCFNPVAKVSLSDAAGDVLASSSLLVQTKTNQAQGWPLAAEWVLWIVLLVVVVVFLIFLFKKGKSTKIMMLLIVVGSLAAIGIGRVATIHAMRYIPIGDDGGEYIITPHPIPAPTYFACVNNACRKVAGSGTNQCSTPGASCSSASISTSTYLACSNSSCVAVPGSGQQNQSCSNVGDSCNSDTEGIAAIAFDINLDNTQYAPNGTIIGSGDFDYILCDNGSELGANDLEMDMTINGVTEPIVTYNNSTWDVPYTGSALATGFNNFIAQSTPGSYSATFTLTADWNNVGNNNYQATQSGSIPYQVVSGGGPVPVVPSASSTGTISVTSEDANNPSVLVPAKWDISGNVSGGLVCSAANGALWNGVPCSGTSEVYPDLPANNDTYGVIPEAAVTSSSAPYSFNSFEQVPIAENKKSNSFVGSFALSLKNILSTVAEAATVSPGSLVLTPSSTSAAFIILWNPLVADMQVSPNTISFASSGSMSQVETITATGAPSANLDWTASASTASGGNWLSVSSGGTVQVGDSGSGTGSATISADAGSLSNGTSTGTVTFLGKDKGRSDLVISTKTVSVTLTVGSGSTPISVSCNPTTVSTNGTSQCTASGGDGSGYKWTVSSGGGTIGSSSGLYTAPGTSGSATITATASDNSGLVSQPVTITISNGSGSPITVSCNPTTVSTNGTSQCSASGGDGSGYVWKISSGSGTINSSGLYTAPGTPGTATITATASDNSGLVSQPVTITITVPPPPACNPVVTPTCKPTISFTATPGNIVVPESSLLAFNVTNATDCSLSGGQFATGTAVSVNAGVASGTVTVAPATSTSYTLTCENAGFSGNNTTTATVQVTVGNGGRCETNPNGVGCPGQ